MDLLDLLRPEHVIVPMHAPDLRAAVQELVAQLEDAGAVRPSEPLHERIRSENMRDVVAIARDVVLPHYRTDAVDTLTLAIGVAPDGIPSADPAGSPVRVVGLILAPPETASLYLQTTSTLARLLRQPDAVEELARQPDARSLLALPRFQNLRIQPSLTVRDVMVHRIHSVPPSATVRRTLDLMLRRTLSAVPVVGEKGEVLGIVTDADIMRALLPKIPRAGSGAEGSEDEPRDEPVRDIMTRSVLCVSEDLGVSEVASMMINKDVEQVPVVNAGSITGMVYRGDIIRKLFGRA